MPWPRRHSRRGQLQQEQCCCTVVATRGETTVGETHIPFFSFKLSALNTDLQNKSLLTSYSKYILMPIAKNLLSISSLT